MLARKNPEFLSILQNSDLNLPDGVGIVWASRMLGQENRIFERISGRDAMMIILRELNIYSSTTNNKMTVLFLGGQDGEAQQAIDHMQAQLRHITLISCEGYDSVVDQKKEESENILASIQHSKPNAIFVAFGAPYQETWIAQNRHMLEHHGVRFAMGVGGAFAQLAGKQALAPQFVQNFGFEWLWRLVHEPWRWKRQLSLISFVFLVMRERFSRSKKQY
ncbi:MAG: Glycosyl transferase, WecB/TagA/CpsF family [Microgenomates group bacterium GW2011_GWF2_45_18]|nr:MAG: Glycosyl transferase, WecB/TagA/CpsF family [Microgenomates group bacterium GW2011_GWF1_44_10]KKU01348.1 MAG: Glycosyl transferase, WecB/TagA/CpsF family [Microgenomates group bacterium GW2011_GWF2_45_18]